VTPVNSVTPIAAAPLEESRPGVPTLVGLLTGGRDRPYALGLAAGLAAHGVTFDFIGSDALDAPQLHRNPLVRFRNLRGSQRSDVPLVRKAWRVLLYYARLVWYAATSDAPIFHVLWNNKIEIFDRTLLMWVYRLLGKRIVFTAHNVNIRRRDGRDSWINRMTLRVQYSLADHIFVHTSAMKREMVADFAVPDDRITVIPFGINSTVPDTSLTRGQARQRLALAGSDKVVLFFGNIAPYKGVEYLVEAMTRLVRSDPTFRLLVVGRPKGETSYWEGVERLIDQLALGPFVQKHIEYVPDADTEIYFKAADVLVLPYTHIFQSGVLFLGYNFGVPAIVSDVGSMKEDVVTAETGFVCPPRNPTALAEAILSYFCSPLYRDIETRRALIREMAIAGHSWESIGATICSVYQSVLIQR
jgi:D-inositol-3-phosphate glycosyltransferase